MSNEPLFVHDGDLWVPAEKTRGPWDPGALHGGAPAALLTHVLSRHPAAQSLRLARLTCELVRPVPLAPLAVQVAVVRPGRRVALLEASITDPAGTVVTRARALHLAVSEVGTETGQAPPFPGPEHGAENDFNAAADAPPMFATHALELRFVEGSFRAIGPATAWFRLRGPVVDDAPVSGAERISAAADFGNGIASELSWQDHVFINPDLTVFYERDPIGEWVAVQARMFVAPGAVALAESVLWDERGRIGRAVQTLLVGRR
ncbi:MAG TPA: thioesterase family protein [Solirubrobacteraceae bacterium]|nr:thioesterase family protein [Solirubrobacteraceae bacterium]